MAMMQVTYASATSVNSIYYAYVYTVVQEEDFTLATSVVVAAVHAGNMIGSLLCQVLDSSTNIGQHLNDYFYISWACTSIGLLCFVCFFPAPRHAPPASVISVMRREGFSLLGEVMKQAYGSLDSAVWSVWWVSGGVAMPYIVSNLYQSQFQHRSSDGPVCLPAFFMQLLSICGAILPAKFVGQKRTVVIGSASCAALGALYLITTLETSLWASYICNTLAVAIYNCQYAYAAAAIARGSSNERYAIVFSTNQFAALGVATVVSAVGSSFSLHTDEYFCIAAGVEGGLAILLCAFGVWFMMAHGLDCISAPSTEAAKELPAAGEGHPVEQDGCYYLLQDPEIADAP